MKRATIEDLEVVDRLAAYYVAKDQDETIIKTARHTAAAGGRMSSRYWIAKFSRRSPQ